MSKLIEKGKQACNLEEFLIGKANELAPDDNDSRKFGYCENKDALSDAWLDNDTSYIWRVGVLAQWDSNKCDYMRLFLGHEREPNRYEFIGMLFYQDGENDDIGRCLKRAIDIAKNLHPTLEDI